MSKFCKRLGAVAGGAALVAGAALAIEYGAPQAPAAARTAHVAGAIDPGTGHAAVLAGAIDPGGSSGPDAIEYGPDATGWA